MKIALGPFQANVTKGKQSTHTGRVTKEEWKKPLNTKILLPRPQYLIVFYVNGPNEVLYLFGLYKGQRPKGQIRQNNLDFGLNNRSHCFNH